MVFSSPRDEDKKGVGAFHGHRKGVRREYMSVDEDRTAKHGYAEDGIYSFRPTRTRGARAAKSELLEMPWFGWSVNLLVLTNFISKDCSFLCRAGFVRSWLWAARIRCSVKS